MGVCCTKSSTIKDNLYHMGYNNDIHSLEKYVTGECFVEFIHANGSKSLFVPLDEIILEVHPDEMIRVNLETIDQQKSTLKISASENFITLKKKVCETMAFSEIILIFKGKVLDMEDQVGKYLPQDSKLDVIPVHKLILGYF